MSFVGMMEKKLPPLNRNLFFIGCEVYNFAENKIKINPENQLNLVKIV